MALPGGVCILITSMGSLSPVPAMVEKLQRGVADSSIAVASGITPQFFVYIKRNHYVEQGLKKIRAQGI